MQNELKYRVDVYENNYEKFAGSRSIYFISKECAKSYATLNQPCNVYEQRYTTDGLYYEKIAAYGWESES